MLHAILHFRSLLKNDLRNCHRQGFQACYCNARTWIRQDAPGATHQRTKGGVDTAVVSYTDLSQISPRNMHSLYSALLAGFTDDYIAILRKTVVNYLLQKAEQNVTGAKKSSTMDSLTA